MNILLSLWRQDIFLYFCSMVKNNIPFKVAVGYVAVAVVMVMAIVLVYGNTQSLLNINKMSRDYNYKRNVVDSLVYSMLDVSNNERSIYIWAHPKIGRSCASLSRKPSA